MHDARLTRRTFLAAAGAASALGLAGCGAGGDTFVPDPASPVAYRLSTRGVKTASNAAKAHAANKVFVSMAAADTNRAHAGDASRIVPVTLSAATWSAWFGGGAAMIDLRHV